MLLREVLSGCSLVLLLGYSLQLSAKEIPGDINLGMKFRGEIYQSDNGLKKTDSYSPAKKQTAKAKANLTLNAKVNQHVEFKSETELGSTGKCMDSGIKWAYAKLKISDMIFFSTGCHKVHQGGWNHATASVFTINGTPVGDGPFPGFAPAVTLGAKVAGKLSLQLLDDINTAGTGQWNKNDKLAGSLDWRGDFGGFEPIVQIGSYDNDKSMYANVGLRGAAAGLSFKLDILTNKMTQKVLKSGSTSEYEGKANQSTSVILYLEYAVPGTVSPYLFVSSYDNKQHTKDVKYNSRDASTEALVWNDNAMVASLGVKLDMFGPGFWPYIGADMTSGKFQKASTSTETETLSETTIKLGTMGKF